MSRVEVLIMAGVWLPLTAVSLVDPAANTVLGLFGMAGSLVGGVFFALSLVGALFRAE